jgi:ElaB/YqjD/DUF883 family membrane-anchored ribosome-binding protein
MTNRDPLYDANAPGSDETIDDLLTDRNTGTSPSGSFSGMDQGSGQDTAGQAKDKASEIGSKAQEKAGEVGGMAQEKAGEVSGTVHEKADMGMDKAASGLGTAAEKLREQGEQQGGKAGTYATTVADKLEGASGYLREKDSDQILTDLEDLVRRKPMESLLAAAGIGLLLSRIVK